MAQQVKAPTTKHAHLNSIPGTHGVKGENQLPQLSSGLHTHAMV